MCALLGLSILVLIVPGLFAIDTANYRPFFTHGMAGFMAALPPLFFAFAGFESLAQTAGEVRDSTRQLPRIFIRGVIAVTIIYLLMSAVGLGVLPGQQLRISSAPMAEAAARYLPAGAAVLVTLGALMAITTSLNATMLVPSRIAIVLAGDDLTPRWLGSVSPRTGTPIAGLTVTLAGALTLLITNQIRLALDIAVFALVLLYLLHSVALLLLPKSNPELYRAVTVSIPLAALRVAAVASMAGMAALLTQMSSATFGLLLFWAALGAALYAVARSRTAGRKKHSQQT
jgi:amino acid transporter